MEYCLNFPDVSVEFFSFANEIDESKGIKNMKDHAFILIGRDQSKNPLDPKEWGPYAVICDPWAHKFYKADEEGLKNNLQYITEDKNQTSTVLKHFDVNKDKLCLQFSIEMIRNIEKKEEKKLTPKLGG